MTENANRLCVFGV